MERTQEEMKSLGVFAIYREGHKVMASYRKIFNQLTLAFMLPLAFIYLAEMELSDLLFPRQRYILYGGLNTNTIKDWTIYTLFKLAYYTFLVIFSLLSTSSVVYSIACIYSNRNISFKKVIAVVPRVWKRLMVTFVVIYAFTFIYIVVVIVTMYLCVANTDSDSLLIYVLLLIYLIGIVYLTIVWQLASIVTVLEDSRGIRAMKKSRKLIKGKFWVALAIFIELNIPVGVILLAFYTFVIYGDFWDMWKRVLVGIACLVLLVPIFLYQLVLQTIIYFVCKAYHDETIDKPAMSNHLGAYERLSDPNEVQMEPV